MQGLHIQSYGVILQDRETGKEYALHDNCAEKLQYMMVEFDSPNRMVGMGPNFDPAQICNFSDCGKTLGEDACN